MGHDAAAWIHWFMADAAVGTEFGENSGKYHAPNILGHFSIYSFLQFNT